MIDYAKLFLLLIFFLKTLEKPCAIKILVKKYELGDFLLKLKM